MSLYRDIKKDLKVNFFLTSISVLDITKMIFQQKAWAIILFRMAAKGNSLARRILAILFHTEIANDVKLGCPLWLPHPYGIVIASGTQIGDNCSIFQRTTFAEKGGVHKGPTIGNNCIIGTGSVIVGNIKIGNNAKIGPNSVVICDVKDNTIAFGNPLQIKTSKSEKDIFPTN